MVEATPVTVDDATLKQVFQSYNGKETTMDGKSFAKLAKDTKLIDKKLTTTDVDLIFAKVKDKAARRITFKQFLNGLQQFADKKSKDVEEVKAKVAGSAGPVLAGTKA